MTINDWLVSATNELENTGIGTARLDCLVLLADLLEKDKYYILAHPEKSVSIVHLTKLRSQLALRKKHQPLAYVRGKTEFYGREFMINTKVLEPRPESETMMDMLQQFKLPQNSLIVDVGTGSGALAVTAKLELPKVRLLATDIDIQCLKIAKLNAQKHGVEIEFFRGDLLQALPRTILSLPLTILANLPYVPTNHAVNQAAMNEPKTAIFGGADGLDLYRQLFNQIKQKSITTKLVLTESLPSQHTQLATIAENCGFHQTDSSDFIQQFSS